MNPVFAVAVFFVIWWIVLFAVLPFAGRTQGEAGEIVPGTPASAPNQLRILPIVLWTTVVSALVFAALFAIFSFGWIDLAPPPPPL